MLDSYRFLIENMPDAFAYHQIIVDKEGYPVDFIFLDVNPAFEAMLGLRKENIIGKKVTQVYPCIQHSSFDCFASYSQVVAKGESTHSQQYFELANKCYEVTAYSAKPGYFVTVFRDITERKQAEKEHRRVFDEYEKVFHGTQDALFLVEVVNSSTFKYIRNNDAHQKLTGISVDELAGKTPQELVGDDLQNYLVSNYSKCVATETPISYEESMELPAGKRAWHTTLTPVFSQGRIAYIVGCSRDITRGKQVEESLRISEEQYRLLVNNANEGIAVYQEGYIKFANPVSEQIYGLSTEEMKSRPWIEFLHPDDREAVLKRSNKRIRGEKVENRYTFRLMAKDGGIKWIENNVVAIKWEGRTAALVLMTDITERKRMEEEIIRADKLDSLGILAGGIAHDFNNLLTIILGNVSLSMLRLDDGSKPYQSQVEIEKAALQAKDLTQQLLTFAKGGKPVREVHSIKEIMESIMPFSLPGSNVRCLTNLITPLPLVNVDSNQLSQVMNNLLFNASQAMPEGGRIYIEVKTVGLHEDDASQSRNRKHPGDYVCIAIRDEGAGIPESSLNKIFDPFFTTKAAGNGLGLTVCYSIIKNHGGYIDVDSQIGEGTTFTLYLPVATEARDKVGIKKEVIHPGKGKILFMDDDEGIRNVVGEMLTSLGYEVVMVSDGMEAFRVYSEELTRKEPFAAVIMDLTIRGSFGGKKTLEKLLTIDKSVKAIVSSGYSNDNVLTEYVKHGFCGAVAKPYKIQELSRVLLDVLGSSTKETY